MIIEAGHFALVLALMVAFIQVVVPLWGASTGRRPLMEVAQPAAILQFVLVAISFAALLNA